MTRLSQLEREAAELEKRIESAILDGDLHTYENLKRAESQLENRQYFARTLRLKENLAELVAERENATELMKDFDAELKTAAQDVIAKRGALMDSEQNYNIIKSRQFALEGQIESFRVAINEAKSKLNSHIAAKVAPVGNDGGDTGNILETRYSTDGQIIS